MHIRQFYSFATELLKMAADIQGPVDADILAQMADREGDDSFLPGGKIRSNSIEDEGQDYAIKLGTDAMNLSSGVYDLKARKKRKNHFQHARDYTLAAGKGAFIGIGGLEASRKLRGVFDRPEAGPAAQRMGRHFRAAAGVGAGLSVLERAYRYRHLPQGQQQGEAAPPAKLAMVAPSAGGAFGSPAQALRKTQQTGSFAANKIHLPRVTQFRG